MKPDRKTWLSAFVLAACGVGLACSGSSPPIAPLPEPADAGGSVEAGDDGGADLDAPDDVDPWADVVQFNPNNPKCPTGYVCHMPPLGSTMPTCVGGYSALSPPSCNQTSDCPQLGLPNAQCMAVGSGVYCIEPCSP